MIKCIASFVFLVAVAEGLKLENCDSSLPVQVSVSKFPAPLVLRKGAKIVLSGKADTSVDLPDKLRVKVEVQKKMWFWVKLPCVRKIGSCTYDVNCGMVRKLGYQGECPVKKGTAAVKDLSITLPEIKAPSFLTNGNYYLKAQISNPYTNAKLGCVTIYVTIKS